MIVDRLLGVIWLVSVSLILFLFHWLKSRERMRIYDLIHQERLRSIERGLPYPELPPYVIEKEEGAQAEARRAFRPGQLAGAAAILILGGAGVMLALYFHAEPELQRNWTMGAIPLMLGLGLLLYAGINRTPADE